MRQYTAVAPRRTLAAWIMVGGDEAAYQTALPVLNAIGASVHYMGATGSGCIAKLCGNHLVSLIVASLAGVAGNGEQGRNRCLRTDQAVGRVGLPFADHRRRGTVDARSRCCVSFHLRTMVKDTELIRNYSESIGVPVLTIEYGARTQQGRTEPR